MRLIPSILSLSLAVTLPAPALDLADPAPLSASAFVRFESSDGRPIDAIRLSPEGASDSGSLAWIDHEGTLHAARADQLGAALGGGGSVSPVKPAPVRAHLAVSWGKDEATRSIWDSATPVQFSVEARGRSLRLDFILVMPGTGLVTRPQLAVSWRLSEGRRTKAGVETAALASGSETRLTLIEGSLSVRLALPADEVASH
jgi:hypothetical protein